MSADISNSKNNIHFKCDHTYWISLSVRPCKCQYVRLARSKPNTGGNMDRKQLGRETGVGSRRVTPQSTLLASCKKTLAKYIGPSDRGVSGWLVNRRPRSCSHSGPRSHHASSLVWYSDLLIAQRPRPSVKPTTFHWLSVVGTKK